MGLEFPWLKGAGRSIIEKGMSRSDSSPCVLREKTRHHSVDASADGVEESRYQAAMCGFRGGDWNDGSTNERVSDRNNAANVNTNRNNNNGARFANTTFL